MAYCSICKAEGKKVPAAMFCANCGKPICLAHTVHGRFCSEACYREYQIKSGGEPKAKKQAENPNKLPWIAWATLFLVVFAIAYYLAPYIAPYLAGI